MESDTRFSMQTLIPRSRNLQIFDSSDEFVQEARLDYWVIDKSSMYGVKVGVLIEEEDGHEMVYVSSQRGPVACMLPNQHEDDHLLLQLFHSWADPHVTTLQVSVTKYKDLYLGSLHSQNRKGIFVRSKNLAYVKSKIKNLSELGHIKVTWAV